MKSEYVGNIADARKYISVSRAFACQNSILQADIYVYMPLNHAIVFFRSQGEELSGKDLETFLSIPEKNLVVLRKQHRELLKKSSEALKMQLGQGDPNSEEVKQGAKSLLRSLSSSDAPVSGLEGGDSLEESDLNEVKEVFKQIPKFVQAMISQFKDTPSSAAYGKVLEAAKNEDDPLEAHDQQVSAISVLMMLTLGENTIDDLTDIGTAGLTHDIGLTQLPQILTQKHLYRESDFSSSEKVAYLNHPQISLEILKTLKIKVTDQVESIILQHHENWDGSGFRGLKENEILRQARILRIADEALSIIQASDWKLNFEAAFQKLTEQNEDSPTPLYHPESLTQLKQTLF